METFSTKRLQALDACERVISGIEDVNNPFVLHRDHSAKSRQFHL